MPRHSAFRLQDSLRKASLGVAKWSALQINLGDAEALEAKAAVDGRAPPKLKVPPVPALGAAGPGAGAGTGDVGAAAGAGSPGGTGAGSGATSRRPTTADAV